MNNNLLSVTACFSPTHPLLTAENILVLKNLNCKKCLRKKGESGKRQENKGEDCSPGIADILLKE